MKQTRNTTKLLFVLVALLTNAWQYARGQGVEKKMAIPESQAVVKSIYNFNDTVGILKEAIEEENMMVIKEIDAQKMLKMVNVNVKGMKQLLFFHPRYMKKILETNRQASIEPPLKIAIMEMPNAKVMVKYIKPAYLLGKYSGLEKLAEELEGVIQRICDSTKQ